MESVGLYSISPAFILQQTDVAFQTAYLCPTYVFLRSPSANQYNPCRLNRLKEDGMNQLKLAVSGAQILFVAFGAMVLVTLLTGLNPALALLGAGLGTLLFQITTKRKVPIFLGSSFAFIAPIIYSVGEWGLPSTMFGLFAMRLYVFCVCRADPLARTGGGTQTAAAGRRRSLSSWSSVCLLPWRQAAWQWVRLTANRSSTIPIR